MTMKTVLVHAADITQYMWLCVTVTDYQLQFTLNLIFKRVICGIQEYGQRQEPVPPPKISTPTTGQPRLLLNGYCDYCTGVKGSGRVPRLRMCGAVRPRPMEWIATLLPLLPLTDYSRCRRSNFVVCPSLSIRY